MKCKTKKIEWNEEEDKLICTLVKRYGTKKWSKMSQELNQTYGGREKSGKQCRQRWYNHLDPSLLKKQWTRFQQDLLFSLHKQHGNKWTIIAEKLQGRNDNSIKNHFYSTLRKSLRRINKFLGSKNSTLKVQKIKSLTLTKLFCLTDQDQKTTESVQKKNEFSQQLRCKELAYHLINFSRNKLSDQKSIVSTLDMKMLQKLLEQLNIINEIYENQIVQNQKLKNIKFSPDWQQQKVKDKKNQQRSKRINKKYSKIIPLQKQQKIDKQFNQLRYGQVPIQGSYFYFQKNDDDISKYFHNQPWHQQNHHTQQYSKQHPKQYINHSHSHQISYLNANDFLIQIPEQSYPSIISNSEPWITMTPAQVTPSGRKHFIKRLDQSMENHQGWPLKSENIQEVGKKLSIHIIQQSDRDMNSYNVKQNIQDI